VLQELSEVCVYTGLHRHAARTALDRRAAPGPLRLRRPCGFAAERAIAGALTTRGPSGGLRPALNVTSSFRSSAGRFIAHVLSLSYRCG
jgi:hypothetical protein